MSMTLAETTLETMLSNCTGIRTFLGAADATAALTRIHRGGLPSPGGYDPHEDGTRSEDEQSTIYPCIIISTQGYMQKQTAVSVTNQYRPSGVINVQLCHYRDVSHDEVEAYADELTKWDYISELWDQTGAGGLNITAIKLLESWKTSYHERASLGNPDDNDRHITADLVESVWEISWSESEP